MNYFDERMLDQRVESACLSTRVRIRIREFLDEGEVRGEHDWYRFTATVKNHTDVRDNSDDEYPEEYPQGMTEDQYMVYMFAELQRFVERLQVYHDSYEQCYSLLHETRSQLAMIDYQNMLAGAEWCVERGIPVTWMPSGPEY